MTFFQDVHSSSPSDHKVFLQSINGIHPISPRGCGNQNPVCIPLPSLFARISTNPVSPLQGVQGISRFVPPDVHYLSLCHVFHPTVQQVVTHQRIQQFQSDNNNLAQPPSRHVLILLEKPLYRAYSQRD